MVGQPTDLMPSDGNLLSLYQEALLMRLKHEHSQLLCSALQLTMGFHALHKHPWGLGRFLSPIVSSLHCGSYMNAQEAVAQCMV